jgi:hypothetical protein
MNTIDLIERLKFACADICPRCHMGHMPTYQSGESEWMHGSDLLPPENDGVQHDVCAPPEHCDAGAVWDVIVELQDSVMPLPRFPRRAKG